MCVLCNKLLLSSTSVAKSYEFISSLILVCFISNHNICIETALFLIVRVNFHVYIVSSILGLCAVFLFANHGYDKSLTQKGMYVAKMNFDKLYLHDVCISTVLQSGYLI